LARLLAAGPLHGPAAAKIAGRVGLGPRLYDTEGSQALAVLCQQHQTTLPDTVQNASFFYKLLKIKSSLSKILRIVFNHQLYPYTRFYPSHQNIEQSTVRKPANRDAYNRPGLSQIFRQVMGQVFKVDG